jgi:hypothetical protein
MRKEIDTRLPEIENPLQRMQHRCAYFSLEFFYSFENSDGYLCARKLFCSTASVNGASATRTIASTAGPCRTLSRHALLSFVFLYYYPPIKPRPHANVADRPRTWTQTTCAWRLWARTARAGPTGTSPACASTAKVFCCISALHLTRRHPSQK